MSNAKKRDKDLTQFQVLAFEKNLIRHHRHVFACDYTSKLVRNGTSSVQTYIPT